MGVETNEHEDVSFKLTRPTPAHIYRVLECENCGNDTEFEIALADNGQWSIECLGCQESAVVISEVINKLR